MRQFAPRCRFVVHPSCFLANAICHCRFGLRVFIAGAGFFAFATPAWAQTPSYTINTTSPAGTQTFGVGSDGYSASGVVPSPAVNLLAAPTTTLTVGGGVQLSQRTAPAQRHQQRGPNSPMVRMASCPRPAAAGQARSRYLVATRSPTRSLRVKPSIRLTYSADGATAAGPSRTTPSLMLSLPLLPRLLNSAPPSAAAATYPTTDNGANWRLGHDRYLIHSVHVHFRRDGYVGYTQLAVLGGVLPRTR